MNDGAADDDPEAAHESHVVFVSFSDVWQLGELTEKKEEYGKRGDDESYNGEGECGRIPKPGELVRLIGGMKRDKEQARTDQTHGEADKDHDEERGIEKATTQVVEDFPLSDSVDWIFDADAFLVANGFFEPRRYLPVASCPAVVAFGVVDVVGWVVVEELYVVD